MTASIQTTTAGAQRLLAAMEAGCLLEQRKETRNRGGHKLSHSWWLVPDGERVSGWDVESLRRRALIHSEDSGRTWVLA